MVCARCGVTTTDGARFCESCGASLVPPRADSAVGAGARCRCGSTVKGDDGFCSECGLRWQPQREPLPRDHIETALTPGFACVTDRGKRHACNEDAAAIGLPDGLAPAHGAALVVCDGVSSSQHADEASDTAAQAAYRVLTEPQRSDGRTAGALLRAAIRAAHEAACRLPSLPDQPKGPPGATIVAALVRDARVTVGWLGDSRAYWIGSDGARLLTHDHSWVNEVVDAGEMTDEEALRSPDAHAITRCLGPLNGDDADEAPEPSLVSVRVEASGWLLLCTDGLWNYAPQIEQLAALVRQASAGSDALAVCRRLVDYALARGGRDNITVALLAIE